MFRVPELPLALELIEFREQAEEFLVFYVSFFCIASSIPVNILPKNRCIMFAIARKTKKGPYPTNIGIRP
jgi:hypothetical protein